MEREKQKDAAKATPFYFLFPVYTIPQAVGAFQCTVYKIGDKSKRALRCVSKVHRISKNNALAISSQLCPQM